MGRSTVRAGLVVLVLALGAAGCGEPSAADRRGDQIRQQADAANEADEQVPDCEDHGCDVEVAAFADALERLPAVERVEDITYVPDSLNGSPEVDGRIWVTRDAARDDCSAMFLPVAELLWQSSISPLDGADLDCYVSGGAADQRYAYVNPRLSGYTVDQMSRWGERGQ